MQETKSMISLLFSISFAATFSASAFVLENNNNNALQLLPIPIPIPPNNNSTNTTTKTTPLLPLPQTPPSPPNTTERVSYVCNDAFGHALSVLSCSDAIRRVGISRTALTFGMRDDVIPGQRDFDIPLPQRFISSDGGCVVEPGLESAAAEGRASWEDVAVAGFVVVRNCVGGEPSVGGVARDIGGDNNLRVFISKYDPTNIRCYGKMRRPFFQAACQEILDDMRASDQSVWFGPGSDPLVDVRLPFLLLSRDATCKFTIRTTGKGRGNTDRWSWGQFWEVGVALAGVCGREGKEGVQTRLGERGHLYMEVGGPQG